MNQGYRVHALRALVESDDFRGTILFLISQAKHLVGQQVPVAYDPDRPGRAYRDSFWDIWGAPLMTFFVQLFAFFGGFSEKRRDK